MKTLRRQADSYQALFRIYCRDLYNSYSDFRLVYSRRFGNDPFLEETVKFKWFVAPPHEDGNLLF